MRRLHIYILGIIALLAAASCRRDAQPAEAALLPQIRLGGDMQKTKAMLNEGGLDVDQTTLQVYDYLTGFTGEINGNSYEDATVAYFNDQIQYSTSTSEWEYVSGKEYRWTKTGTHNFFGWLTYDKASDLRIADILPEGTVSFDSGTRVLTIPANTVTAASKQFDFAYSGAVVSRAAETKDYSKVELEMAHLFSAIALTVENKSSEPVTINSITMPNLPTRRSATLNFSGLTTSIATYGTPASGTPFFGNPFPAGGLTLTKKETAGCKANVFTGAVLAAGAQKDYRMTWPLDKTVLSPTTTNPYEGQEGNRYKESANNPADSLIRISYTYNMTVGGTPQTITRNDIGVKFPNTLSFEPGKMYTLNITVNDKVISLEFEVQDWEFSEYILEFTSDAATVPDPFAFIENTYDHMDGKRYYTKGASPILAKFRITNPIGAKIHASPIGDTHYFNVTVSPDVVNPTVNNGEILVTITPNTEHGTPTSDKTLKLSFSLLNGTRETNIDSEVRGDDLIVVWAN